VELLDYIKDLLLKNDYVILPGIGGFSGHYKPAGIHEGNYTPPCKSIRFDKNLKYNDNLITDYIIKNEGISHTEASNKVSRSVKNILYRLGEGDKIEIPDIGILQFDLKGNLYFTEQLKKNFNISSFGMPSFRVEPSTQKELKKTKKKYRFWKKASNENKIPVQKKKSNTEKENIPEKEAPIIKETNHIKKDLQEGDSIQNKEIIPTTKSIPMSEPIQKEETDLKNETPPTKNPVEEKETADQKKTPPAKEPIKKKDIDSKGMMILKILLVLAVVIVLALIINKELDNKQNNKLPVKEKIIVPAQPQDSLAMEDHNSIDSTEKTEEQIVVNEKTISTKNNNPKNLKNAEKASSSDASYFIIGGVFKSHEHAVKYMNEMKAKGCLHVQDINFVRDLHYVSIDQFSTLNDAKIAKKKILTEDPKSGVWIYKKH